MLTIQPENPNSKEEILSCLALLQKEVEFFFHKIGVNYFFTHSLGGWSPSENLSHLTFTTNILALSFRFPRFILKMIYGNADSERAFYDMKLLFSSAMKYPQDAGFFAPAIEPNPRDSVEKSLHQMKDWNNACINLSSSLEGFTENDLSGYRLPHPLLGKVTFREMCFLHILHILHHCEKVESKLKNISRITEFS